MNKNGIKFIMSGENFKKLPKDEIEKILDNSRASLSIEGLEVTEDETEVIRKYFEGEYTEEEVLEIIRNKGVK